MDVSEEFYAAVEADNKCPLARIEIYNTETNAWYSLQNITSFDVAISRDDNRPLLYTAMPPVSTITLRMLNKNGMYTSKTGADRFSGIIEPDTPLRVFMGYRIHNAIQTFVHAETPRRDFAVNDMAYSFKEDALFLNTGINDAMRLSLVEWTHYPYNAQTKRAFRASFYDTTRPYGESRYGHAGEYRSRIFEINDFNTGDKAELIAVKFSIIEAEGSAITFSYQLCDTYDGEWSPWSEEISAKNETPIAINKTAHYFRYRLIWHDNRWGVPHSEVASAHISARAHYQIFPVFFGFIDIPKLIVSAEERTLSITGRNILKKTLDERLGAISFTGVRSLESIVMETLSRSPYFTEETLGEFETTGITIDLGEEGVSFAEGLTLRNALNSILEIAYRYDARTKTATFFRLFDDEHGRVHFKKERALSTARFVFSYTNNLKEAVRFQDVYKMINRQTVKGEETVATYPEQIVATKTITLSANEFETHFVLALHPSPPANANAPVTSINFSFTNEKNVLVYENDALLEGDMSRKSYNIKTGHGELGLTVRNLTYAIGPSNAVTTTITVRATPLRDAVIAVAEAADQNSILRYGEKAGETIQNPFIRSMELAENIARAIVAYRKAPFQRAECTFVNGMLLPFVRLNETYRIVEPNTNLYDLYIVSEIRHVWSAGEKRTMVTMESGGLIEPEVVYDNDPNAYTGDAFLYDTGHIFDERVEEETEIPQVLFSS